MISNCTGLPVFCWITVDRLRIFPPLTTSPIFSLTRSQPRRLLSIAMSNCARRLGQWSGAAAGRRGDGITEQCPLSGSRRSRYGLTMAGQRILGAILAGGNSERFGSDKALAELGGQKLFDHVHVRLAPQVDAVVCCGRDWPGLTVLVDRPEPGLGPLAGLCAALLHAEANGFDTVISVPVDVVPVPPNLADLLGHHAPSVLTNQFLVGLWPAALGASLERHLANGKRAVRSWLDSSNVRYVDDSGLKLVNINHTHDIYRLTKPSGNSR